MKCVYCACIDSKVTDSRPTEDGNAIRRRRECVECGKRFTTYEKIEQPTTLVVKTTGEREPFDPNKIRSGLIKSCQKRPVSANDIEKIVSSIEKHVYNSLEQEVSSQDIGEMVMNQLRDVDQVSYVRFASVYRSFKDIQTFKDELNKLIDS